MGVVFLAADLRLGRQVAIKVLDPRLIGFVGAERFLGEIRTLAPLNHPNILPLLDSGEVDELLYYVMPFVPGQTLRDRLTRERALPVREAVTIAMEVADALAYAHAHDVAHRDIKPENILLSSGHAIVVDFGIAGAITDATTAPKDGGSEAFALGTAAYMSPEQASGDPHPDGRTDIYALGCVLYEMLTGDPPFGFGPPHTVLARQRTEPHRPVRVLRASAGMAIESVLDRSLAKAAADRFPTALQMREALAVAQEGGTPVQVRRRWPAWTSIAMVPAVIALFFLARLVPHRATVEAGMSPPAAAPTSIAVLYLDDLSRDTSLGYLARGLTEELITRLQGVPTLEVRSPEAVAPYRHGGSRLDSLARTLQVGTVVGGSVTASGSILRVQVRLMDPVHGTQIDHVTVEAPFGDLLHLRDTITEEVARRLRSRLGQVVELSSQRAEAPNSAAWELVQRAQEVRARAAGGQESSLPLLLVSDSLLAMAERRAEGWLEPTLLRGWVAFDLSQAVRVSPAWEAPAARWLQTASARANDVLNVRPEDPAALELRGTVAYRRYATGAESRPQELASLLAAAEHDLRRAGAEPWLHQAAALRTLSVVLATAGRTAESYAVATEAYERDAYLSDAGNILLQLYYGALDLRREGEAASWCRRGQQLFPGNWVFLHCGLTLMGWADSSRVTVDSGWRLVHRADALLQGADRAVRQAQVRLLLAAVLARAGLGDSARHVITEARRLAGSEDLAEVLFDEALARMRLGERPRTLQVLDSLLRLAPRYAPVVRELNAFAPLRTDSAFTRLVEGR